MATHRAVARICLDLEVEPGEDPGDVLAEELGDFLRKHGIADLFKIKEVLETEPTENTDTEQYGYQQALDHLEQLGDLREDGIFTGDDQLALDKAKQAIRDCMEMGLNGIGE
jgi:DNA-binding LacI/PurR family transcriptional regulator